MDASTADDATLLAAAQNGDRAAVEALIVRYQPRVMRFGLRMCRDRADAEDIVQETLLAAARGLRQFRGGSSLSTWLYTIARSYCIKKHRRSKFAPTHEASLDDDANQEAKQLPTSERTPEQAAMDQELQVALSRAIDGLEPMYKEVLVLRDVEGLTAPEVAEVVGAKVGAVKSRLHRARAQVREALLPYLERQIEPAGPQDCPDIVELFSRNLEGDIDSQLCHKLQEHVESCPRCKQKCASIQQVMQLCQLTPAPDVPDEMQQGLREALRTALSELQSNSPTGSLR